MVIALLFLQPPSLNVSTTFSAPLSTNNDSLNMVKKRAKINPFAAKRMKTFSSGTRLTWDADLTIWPPDKPHTRDERIRDAHPWSIASLQIDSSPFWASSSLQVENTFGHFDKTGNKTTFRGNPRFMPFVRIFESKLDHYNGCIPTMPHIHTGGLIYAMFNITPHDQGGTQLIYVGETSQTVLQRELDHFNEARRAARAFQPNSAGTKVDQFIAAHPNGAQGWRILTLEQFSVPANATYNSVAHPKEQYWISRLNSVEPKGLNAKSKSPPPPPPTPRLLLIDLPNATSSDPVPPRTMPPRLHLTRDYGSREYAKRVKSFSIGMVNKTDDQLVERLHTEGWNVNSLWRCLDVLMTSHFRSLNLDSEYHSRLITVFAIQLNKFSYNFVHRSLQPTRTFTIVMPFFNPRLDLISVSRTCAATSVSNMLPTAFINQFGCQVKIYYCYSPPLFMLFNNATTHARAPPGTATCICQTSDFFKPYLSEAKGNHIFTSDPNLLNFWDPSGQLSFLASLDYNFRPPNTSSTPLLSPGTGNDRRLKTSDSFGQVYPYVFADTVRRAEKSHELPTGCLAEWADAFSKYALFDMKFNHHDIGKGTWNPRYQITSETRKNIMAFQKHVIGTRFDKITSKMFFCCVHVYDSATNMELSGPAYTQCASASEAAARITSLVVEAGCTPFIPTPRTLRPNLSQQLPAPPPAPNPIKGLPVASAFVKAHKLNLPFRFILGCINATNKYLSIQSGYGSELALELLGEKFMMIMAKFHKDLNNEISNPSLCIDAHLHPDYVPCSYPEATAFTPILTSTYGVSALMDAYNTRVPDGAKSHCHSRFVAHDITNCYNVVDQDDVVSRCSAMITRLVFTNTAAARAASASSSSTPLPPPTFATHLDRFLTSKEASNLTPALRHSRNWFLKVPMPTAAGKKPPGFKLGWTHTRNLPPEEAGKYIVISADDYKLMLKNLMKSGYAFFQGQVFHQTRGIPMGTQGAPHHVQFYLGCWELHFLEVNIAQCYAQKRAGRVELASLRRVIECGQYCRYLDDLIRFFISATVSGAEDPFYLTYLDRLYHANVHLDPQGAPSLGTHYCDLDIMFHPDTFKAVSVLFDKRRGPAYANITFRRFPHCDTNMSERCIYGVLTSQLFRFRRVTSLGWPYFLDEVLRLMVEMSLDGYSDAKLLCLARRFVIKSGRLYGRATSGNLQEVTQKFHMARLQAVANIHLYGHSAVEAAALAAHTAAFTPLPTIRSATTANATTPTPPSQPASNTLQQLLTHMPFHFGLLQQPPIPPPPTNLFVFTAGQQQPLLLPPPIPPLPPLPNVPLPTPPPLPANPTPPPVAPPNLTALPLLPPPIPPIPPLPPHPPPTLPPLPQSDPPFPTLLPQPPPLSPPTSPPLMPPSSLTTPPPSPYLLLQPPTLPALPTATTAAYSPTTTAPTESPHWTPTHTHAATPTPPPPVNHTPTHAITSPTPPTYTSISSLMPSQLLLLSPSATSNPDDSEMDDASAPEISNNDDWKMAVVIQMREAVDWLVNQYHLYTTGGGQPLASLDYNKVDEARKTWRRSVVKLYGEDSLSQHFLSRTTAKNNFHYRLFSDPGPDDVASDLHSSDDEDSYLNGDNTHTFRAPSPPLPASWQLPPLPPPYDDDDEHQPTDHQQHPLSPPTEPAPLTVHQQQQPPPQPSPAHPTATSNTTRPPPGPATRAGLAELAMLAASITSTSANHSPEPPTANPNPQLAPFASAPAPTPTTAPTPAFAIVYDPTQTPPPPILRDDHVAPPPPPPFS